MRQITWDIFDLFKIIIRGIEIIILSYNSTFFLTQLTAYHVNVVFFVYNKRLLVISKSINHALAFEIDPTRINHLIAYFEENY